MLSVFIDPGVRALGTAVFQGTELVWAGLVPGARTGDGAACAIEAAWALAAALNQRRLFWEQGVVEWPSQADKRAAGARQDISDLTAVAAGVCVILGMRGAVQTFTPVQWKGQVPKHIHHARVFPAAVCDARFPRIKGFTPSGAGVLTAADLARIEWDTVRTENTDIADAVALGVWHTRHPRYKSA